MLILVSLDLRGHILDVGCGAEHYRDLFPAGCDYQGIDMEDAGENFGYQKPDVIYYDGVDFPIADSSMDPVFQRLVCPVGQDGIFKKYEEALYDNAEEADYAGKTYVEYLKKVLPAFPKGKALDIGTGNGSYLLELKRAGVSKVIGVEPSRIPVELSETILLMNHSGRVCSMTENLIWFLCFRRLSIYRNHLIL